MKSFGAVFVIEIRNASAERQQQQQTQKQRQQSWTSHIYYVLVNKSVHGEWVTSWLQLRHIRVAVVTTQYKSVLSDVRIEADEHFDKSERLFCVTQAQR